MSFYIYHMNEEGIGLLLRRIFRLGYGRRPTQTCHLDYAC